MALAPDPKSHPEIEKIHAELRYGSSSGEEHPDIDEASSRVKFTRNLTLAFLEHISPKEKELKKSAEFAKKLGPGVSKVPSEIHLFLTATLAKLVGAANCGEQCAMGYTNLPAEFKGTVHYTRIETGEDKESTHELLVIEGPTPIADISKPETWPKGTRVFDPWAKQDYVIDAPISLKQLAAQGRLDTSEHKYEVKSIGSMKLPLSAERLKEVKEYLSAFIEFIEKTKIVPGMAGMCGFKIDEKVFQAQMINALKQQMTRCDLLAVKHKAAEKKTDKKESGGFFKRIFGKKQGGAGAASQADPKAAPKTDPKTDPKGPTDQGKSQTL